MAQQIFDGHVMVKIEVIILLPTWTNMKGFQKLSSKWIPIKGDKHQIENAALIFLKSTFYIVKNSEYCYIPITYLSCSNQRLFKNRLKAKQPSWLNNYHTAYFNMGKQFFGNQERSPIFSEKWKLSDDSRFCQLQSLTVIVTKTNFFFLNAVFKFDIVYKLN